MRVPVFNPRAFGAYAEVAREVLYSASFESMLRDGVRVPITQSGKRVFICLRCYWWSVDLSEQYSVCPECGYSLGQHDLLQFLVDNADKFETIVKFMSGGDYWKSEEWRKRKGELLAGAYARVSKTEEEGDSPIPTALLKRAKAEIKKQQHGRKRERGRKK